MRIGVLFPTVEIGGDPIAIRDWTQATEDLGYDHIWVYEHDYRQLSEPNLEKMLKRRRQFEEVVRSLLVAAMDEGVFREADPSLATLQFLNMHNHTYQWVKPGQQWTASYLSQTYCRTLFIGFSGGEYDIEALEAAVREHSAATSA